MECMTEGLVGLERLSYLGPRGGAGKSVVIDVCDGSTKLRQLG